MSAPLVEVRDLKVWFPVKKGLLQRTVGHVRAVDGVSFDVRPGETLALVGESGCGKTTCGRALLRLIEPTAGAVQFDGVDVRKTDGQKLRDLRRRMQIIFQDPYGSLNPRMTVSALVGDALSLHGLVASKAERTERVQELLQTVGLPGESINRYPHEFSGGQRQRLCIARALALNPDFIVCDEAVSALDVSIQAQILNLLERLQEERGLAYLFISHDLSVVRHIADRIAVMYLGRIVELADTEALFRAPRHPYTRALLSAIPTPIVGRDKERVILQGEPPSPVNPPSGCAFHPRCPDVMDVCRAQYPAVARLNDPAAEVVCHLYPAADPTREQD